MSHQDWKTISISNPSKKIVEKTIVAKKGDMTMIEQQRKLENDT